MLIRLGLGSDDVFWQHRGPAYHPERPERLTAVMGAIERCEHPLIRVGARDATLEELQRVHTGPYLASLASLAGKRGQLDPDTYYNEVSYAAAIRAAGLAIALIEGLESSMYDYGFLAARPPGHHASADRAMGFCLINSAAVAAAHALARGLGPVAIFDWDVHHGNGTEAIFYGSREVLYASVHESPLYPGTGDVGASGVGEGEGYTVNLPLPAGSGDAEYLEAMRRLFVPVLEAFQPGLLIVSAGFDSHASDPLGGMQLSDGAYGQLTRELLEVMPDRGKGRILFVLEGGYDLQGLSAGVDSTLAALGAVTERDRSVRSCSRAGEVALRAAVRVHTRHWPGLVDQ